MMRDLLFKDFGWKLFSLLLAAFIWYTVQKVIEEPKAAVVSPTSISVTYGDVPVFVMATAANMSGYGINSNMVSVTVSGQPDVMDVLQKNQIHALVDLSDFDDRSRDLDRRVEVAVPWGVTVISVEPARVNILRPKPEK
jgi:YbbR domain-containing protein